MIRAYQNSWRTHYGRTPREFEVCRDQACPKDHFISSLKGSRPVEDSWEGVLDSNGKVPK